MAAINAKINRHLYKIDHLKFLIILKKLLDLSGPVVAPKVYILLKKTTYKMFNRIISFNQSNFCITLAIYI